jgi:hypothetical protein
MAIADAGKTVLVPAIGSGSGMIVGKRFPGFASRAVVFAYGSPSPFAQIGPPTLPMLLTFRVFLKALLFCQDRVMSSG